MNVSQLRGCGTALVTPFAADGSLDEPALRRLIQSQIAAGIDFLVPCGSTGESPVLTREEHLRVIQITVEECHGKLPVLAGAGGNNTKAVCELIRSIEQLGADAILSASPSYNKPTQEGIYRHYCALAEASALPVMVYNVPGRTGSNVEARTIIRLAEVSNIFGVKEASGNIGQVDEILSHVPEQFRVFSGDDGITVPLMALGACGVISVVSNAAPREMTDLARLCIKEDYVAARRLHRRLSTLMQVLFIESNPIPVKAALAAMGMIQPVYRLPLLPIRPENGAKVEAALKQLGLLSKEKSYVAG